MLGKLLIAGCLVAATVVIHAVGLMLLVVPVLHKRTRKESGFSSVTWLVIETAWALILLHLVEIAVWALFYWGEHCLPDLESAFYFAGVTYTTVGYGDLVLPKEWRLLGPIEALAGILMCGLSTGFFFALVSRVYASRLAAKPR
jgi:Ion channel